MKASKAAKLSTNKNVCFSEPISAGHSKGKQLVEDMFSPAGSKFVRSFELSNARSWA